MNERVQHYVDEHRDLFLAELMEACRIPSVSEQEEPLAEMAAWLKERLERAGCSATFWPADDGPPIVWA